MTNANDMTKSPELKVLVNIFAVVVFIVFGLFSTAALANKKTQHLSLWKDGNAIYKIREDDAAQIFITYECYPYGKKFDASKCEAAKASKSVSFKNVNNDLLVGGKNPGAVLCKESVSGKVLILKNSRGDESSFCQFADGSLVATATLQKWAK